MKRLTFAVPALAVLLMLTLAGCPNAAGLRHDADQPPAQTGTGYVTLRFGTPTGRTLLPDTFNFPGHLGRFIPVPADDGRVPVVVGNLQQPQVLDVGQWRLEISVFSHADPDEYDDPLATGEAGPFAIVEGDNPPIIVPLVFDHGEMEGEQGTFTWNIAHEFDNAHQMEITLFYLGDARENDQSIFVTTTYGNTLATALAGTRAVAAGFYIVTVRMEMDAIVPLYVDGAHTPGHFTGARRAIWSDVMHVYPMGTTRLGTTDAPFEFGANDYFHAITQAWLFGYMTGWETNDLAGKEMTLRPEDGTLYWVGNLWTREAGYLFRFSLTDTSHWGASSPWSEADNRRRGAWFVPTDPGNNNFDFDFMRLHHTNPAAVSRAWTIDAGPGRYRITLDPIERRFAYDLIGSVILPVDDVGRPEIWLAGFEQWPWALPGTRLVPGEAAETFVGSALVSSAHRNFRFSLTDTEGWDHPFNGNWLAPVTLAYGDSENVPAALGPAGNPMWHFPTNTADSADQATRNSWRIDYPGYYRFTVDFNNFRLRVERPVASVTIDQPNNTEVERGLSLYFTATVTVDGSDAPNANAVTWSVHGASAGTTIEETSGRLSVARAESADTIRVRAESVLDPWRYAEITVMVTGYMIIEDLWLVGHMDSDAEGRWNLPGAEMTPLGNGVFTWTGDVLVPGLHQSPAPPPRFSFRFSLADTTDRDPDYQWIGDWLAPVGNHVTVDGDGTPNDVVRASGDIPNREWVIARSGIYTITVDTEATPMTMTVDRDGGLSVEAMWLVGSAVGGWTVPGESMERNDDGIFTWEGEVLYPGAFRFSITNTVGWGGGAAPYIWRGGWLAAYRMVGGGLEATLGDELNNVVRHEANSTPSPSVTTNSNWRVPSGWYRFTVDPFAETLRVDRPVESVTITASPATVDRGASGSLIADVVFTGTDAAYAGVVNWDVVGRQSSGTNITPTGDRSATLNVSGTETAGTLTIRATSAIDPGRVYTVEVEVTGHLEDLWLVGHMAANGWELPGERMTRQDDGRFTWTGVILANTSPQNTRSFRFGLYEIQGIGGEWLAPAGGGYTAVTFGSAGNTVVRASGNIGHRQWSTTSHGVYTITVDPAPGDLRMYVNRVSDAVWLVGAIPPPWDPHGVLMDLQADGTFTRDVDVTAANNTFRFARSYKRGWGAASYWQGYWFIPAGPNTPAGPSNDMQPHYGTTDNNWVINATGDHRITVNPNARTFTVVPLPAP